MKIEDLKSGMAFETKSGKFHVVTQLFLKDETPLAAIFNNRERMDWSMLFNFSFGNRNKDYCIEKVYAPVRRSEGWELVWEKPKMKSLTKKDLRTGMRLVSRKGKEYIVLLSDEYEGGGIVTAINGKSWDELSSYNDKLSVFYDFANGDDIVRVYSVPPYAITRPLNELNNEDITLLWEEPA